MGESIRPMANKTWLITPFEVNKSLSEKARKISFTQ